MVLWNDAAVATRAAKEEEARMAKKLGWGLFLFIAGWLLVLGTMDLFPDTQRSRDDFRELVTRGVERTATVVDLREEEIENYEGDTHTRFYVTLEYTHAGRTYRREQRFQRPQLVRQAWERIGIGEPVDVRAHPENPAEFYAPAYLELGEAMAPSELGYVGYRVLAAVVLVLMGALLYLKVFRGARPAAVTEGTVGAGRR